MISGLEHSDYLSGVEWETLLFFAGLFVMVGALVKTGVVDQLARLATEATGGQPLLATMTILVVSFVISGVVNNVPYAATMAPIVAQLIPAMPGHVHPQVLWWALVLGTDLGGNLTAVGASANVVILGIARRADSPISFWEFTRKGVIVTAISVGLSAAYLWLRYFVLGLEVPVHRSPTDSSRSGNTENFGTTAASSPTRRKPSDPSGRMWPVCCADGSTARRIRCDGSTGTRRRP